MNTIPPEMVETCRRIRRLREAAGFTRPALGRLINADSTQLSNIENFRCAPSERILTNLSCVLGASERWLLTGQGAPLMGGRGNAGNLGIEILWSMRRRLLTMGEPDMNPSEVIYEIKRLTDQWGSRAALAKELGVSRQRLNEWLSGRSRPNATHLLNLIKWMRAATTTERKEEQTT